MEQFNNDVLATLLNNLKMADDSMIFELHKYVTVELHERLEGNKRLEGNNNTGGAIDKELQSDRYKVDENEYYDCNCQYECKGLCHEKKPRLSQFEQSLQKKQLNDELDEYMEKDSN